MRFLRRLFGRKNDEPGQDVSDASSRKIASRRQMLTAARDASIFTPMPAVPPAEPPMSATGIYETVNEAMKSALDEKRKAKEAAQRVSDAVGTTGSTGKTPPIGLPLPPPKKAT